MKKTPRSSRDPISSRLAAYSATATAALLLAPGSARADVIQSITSSGSLVLDYGHPNEIVTAGIAAGPAANLYFWGQIASNNPLINGDNQIGLAGKSNDFVAIDKPAGYSYLHNFSAGGAIAGAGGGFFAQGNGTGRGGIALSHTFPTGVSGGGQFKPASSSAPATGYVGFKHVANGHNYYGWLRVKVTENGNDDPATISLAPDGDGVVGAYDATPDGTALLAGEVAIPEPATVAMGLGLLALGAAGIREQRRRKAAPAA